MDLLDLSIAESLGLYLNYQIYLDFLITWNSNSDKCFFFFHTRKENSGFYGIFQIIPETQAKLTHTKDELFNPSQGKLEEQQSQWGAVVQPYLVIT